MSKRYTTPRADDILAHGRYTVMFIEIDPEMAKAMLESNTHNRSLKAKHVSMARDMNANNWQFNGDTIRFSKTGVLLDGQHRLQAIIDSGTTQLFLVVQGLPDVAQDTMDQGTKRLAGDQLHLRGEKNGMQMAAVLNNLIAIKSGTGWARSVAPTLAEKLEFLDEHLAAVREATDVAMMARNNRVKAPPAAIGAAYYLCAEKSRTAAQSFYVDRLIESVGLTPGDPAKTLGMRFERMSEDSGSYSADIYIRYALSAWNAWRKGEKRIKLQSPRGGFTAENFPKPK